MHQPQEGLGRDDPTVGHVDDRLVEQAQPVLCDGGPQGPRSRVARRRCGAARRRRTPRAPGRRAWPRTSPGSACRIGPGRRGAGSVVSVTPMLGRTMIARVHDDRLDHRVDQAAGRSVTPAPCPTRGRRRGTRRPRADRRPAAARGPGEAAGDGAENVVAHAVPQGVDVLEAVEIEVEDRHRTAEPRLAHLEVHVVEHPAVGQAGQRVDERPSRERRLGGPTHRHVLDGATKCTAGPRPSAPPTRSSDPQPATVRAT